MARTSKFVIPAKAGIQPIKELDSASSAERHFFIAGFGVFALFSRFA
jgi:hypothetical protein